MRNKRKGRNRRMVGGGGGLVVGVGGEVGDGGEK